MTRPVTSTDPRVRWVDQEPHPVALSWAALTTAVGATVTLVAVAPRHGGAAPVLALLASVGGAAVALLERRHHRLGTRVVVGAIGLVMAVAVLTPPRTSNDLWSYGAYGRLVVVHHENPYTSTPADHPDDPFSRKVSAMWKHTRNVYGPLWTGVAVADASVVGTSTLANRLVFQSIAAIAVGAALVIVWRRTRSAAALAFLGLHPVFTTITINGGHVDALVGLAVLVAAVLAARHRPIAAGVAIALATLTKLTGVLGGVGIVLWLVRAGRARSAVRMSIATVLTIAVGYLPFVDSIPVLSHANHIVSPWSSWNGLADALLGHDAWRSVAHPLAYNRTLLVLSSAGIALTAVLMLVLGWRAARGTNPRDAAGTAAATYTFAATYSLPWYADWALPSCADDAPSTVGWVVWIASAAMLVTLKLRPHPTGTLADQVVRGAMTDVVPLLLLAAFVWSVLRPRRGVAASSADRA